MKSLDVKVVQCDVLEKDGVGAVRRLIQIDQRIVSDLRCVRTRPLPPLSQEARLSGRDPADLTDVDLVGAGLEIDNGLLADVRIEYKGIVAAAANHDIGSLIGVE